MLNTLAVTGAVGSPATPSNQCELVIPPTNLYSFDSEITHTVIPSLRRGLGI